MPELWACVTPERERKTQMLMRAICAGWPGAKLRIGAPPDDGVPFIVWGQKFLTERILPQAIRDGRPFWHIDNGYWLPARGTISGYYRITYRGLSPVLLHDADRERLPVEFRPWRTVGRKIVFALPGQTFGAAAGLNMPAWISSMQAKLLAQPRPVLVREKNLSRPLEPDLDDAHCLVTHSSNVAVDSVLLGVPVIVAASSPAAPVGSTNFGDFETLARPDRAAWWASLMSQQFTVQELTSGKAYRALEAVREQVDLKRRAA